jgi:hypothetical protein
LQRGALVVGKCGELLRDCAAKVREPRELVDPRDLIWRHGRHLDPEASEAPALGDAATDVACQDVAGDAEQPGFEVVVRASTELLAARIGPRKRLRCEIEGDLGVVRAAGQEEQDRVRVPPVRGREYGSIAKIGRIIGCALGAHIQKCHEARYP